MKFTNEKYPFAKLIEEGKYDRVEGLVESLDLFKMNNISQYEKQFFCSTFREEVNNNAEKIRELFPAVLEFTGCEIESSGLGYYFSINPNVPDGLKAIIVQASSNSEIAVILEKLPDSTMAKIINSNILQKQIEEMKRPKVILLCRSVNFIKTYTQGSRELIFDYWPIKMGGNSLNVVYNHIALKFYEWIFISLFKKYVKTEIQIIGDESGHKKYFGGVKFFSDFAIRVFQYDRTYWREIIRNIPFMVGEGSGGFPRKQKCGKGRSEERTVWIKPFQKKGYHSHAKKDLINKPE